MSLIGHLTELRTRLIICLLAVFICLAVSLFFAPRMLSILTAPIKSQVSEPGREKVIRLKYQPDGTLKLEGPPPTAAEINQYSERRWELIFPGKPDVVMNIGQAPTQQFYYSGPMDPIFMELKVALIMGLVFALPIILRQIWLFIRPGLKFKERKVVAPVLGIAVILFPIGSTFAYFMVAMLLQVMQHYHISNVSPLLNIFSYLSLMFNLMLVFGVIFEVPLVLGIASRIGLVNPELLSAYRRHAYVILTIAAAVIAPGADPLSLFICLVPLVLLYEISIWVSVFMARMHRADLAAEEAENDEEEPEAES